MDNFDFVENFRGFDIYRNDYCYLVKHGSNFCGFYDFYSQALNAVHLWHKNFGDDKND